jgi:flagellar protein FlaG
VILGCVASFREVRIMDMDIVRRNIEPKVVAFKPQELKVRKDLIEKLPGKTPEEPLKNIETFDDEEYLNDAIVKLRKAGDLFNRRLDFQVDKDTQRIIVKVIDTETDKVIKEIPPEQLVQLAAKIQEMVGLLVDEER